MKIDFVKTLEASAPYIPGTIYFESSTSLIKVATANNQYRVYGGVRDASYDASADTLTIQNGNGDEIYIDFSQYVNQDEYKDDQYVISYALNELNTNFLNHDTAINSMYDNFIHRIYMNNYNVDITNGTAYLSQSNADWNATSGVQRILNKPDLSLYMTTADYEKDEEVIAAAFNDLNDRMRLFEDSSLNYINTINTIKVNGSVLTPDASKAVNITVPTDASLAETFLPLYGGIMNEFGEVDFDDSNGYLQIQSYGIENYSNGSTTTRAGSAVFSTTGLEVSTSTTGYLANTAQRTEYTDGSIYKYRTVNNVLTQYTYAFPDASGTLALTSDIPATLHIDLGTTASYLLLKLTGRGVWELTSTFKNTSSSLRSYTAYHNIIIEEIPFNVTQVSYSVTGYVFEGNGNVIDVTDKTSINCSKVLVQSSNTWCRLKLCSAWENETFAERSIDITVLNGEGPADYIVSNDAHPGAGSWTEFGIVSWSFMYQPWFTYYNDETHSIGAGVEYGDYWDNYDIVSASTLVKDGGGLTGLRFNGVDASVDSSGVASISATFPTLVIDVGEEPTSAPSGTFAQCQSAIRSNRMVALMVTDDEDGNKYLYVHQNTGTYHNNNFVDIKFYRVGENYIFWYTLSSNDSLTKSFKQIGTLTGVKFNNTNATVSNGVASITATIPSTLDQIADGSTRKLANYLPKTGGTISSDNTTGATGIEPGYIWVGDGNSACTLNLNYIDRDLNSGDEVYQYYFPSKNGTFALTSDIPTDASIGAMGYTKNTGTLTGVKFNNTNATINGTVAEITATIPTVNNATLSILKNGTSVGTFTANSSTDTSINIQVNEVPTPSTTGTVLHSNGSSWVESQNMHDVGDTVQIDYNKYLIAYGSLGSTTLDTAGILKNSFSDWSWIKIQYQSNETIVTENLQDYLDARSLPTPTSWGQLAESYYDTASGNYEWKISSFHFASPYRLSAPINIGGFVTYNSSGGIFCLDSDGLWSTVNNWSWIKYSYNNVTTTLQGALDGKQNTLVGSGTGQNIKTVNNNSLVGSGNVSVGTLTGVKFNNTNATINGTVAEITATIPAAPGTLKTNNTAAQTASASEALSGTINLHKVAKTGTYSDLIGTPTIPAAANNATISIQKGGTAVDSFTVNASTNKTINIPNELPTVTTTDNGKILKVVNGAWAAATPITVYSGSNTPNNSTGINGDIYIQS